MTRRNYSGPIIDVSFDRAICQHAAECIRGMPDVFDTKRRPWINPTTPGLRNSPSTCVRLLDVAPPAPWPSSNTGSRS